MKAAAPLLLGLVLTAVACVEKAPPRVFVHPEYAARRPATMALDVKGPEDGIPIMGGVVGTTENTFFRRYSLSLGEHTYALLMLDRREGFDDGICLCGDYPRPDAGPKELFQPTRVPV